MILYNSHEESIRAQTGHSSLLIDLRVCCVGGGRRQTRKPVVGEKFSHASECCFTLHNNKFVNMNRTVL